jgi:hypothetical protein
MLKVEALSSECMEALGVDATACIELMLVNATACVELKEGTC